MSFDQVLELLKIIGPLIIAFFGFKSLYKINDERIKGFKEREAHLEKSKKEMIEIKEAEIHSLQEILKNLKEDHDKLSIKYENLSIKYHKLCNERLENFDNNLELSTDKIEQPINIFKDKYLEKIVEKNIKFLNLFEISDINKNYYDVKTLLIFHMYNYAIKEFDKSLQCLDKALEIQPSNSFFHSYKSGTLKKLKRFEKAINSAKEAIRLNKNNGDAYYNLATIQIQQGLEDIAIENIVKAITLNNKYLSYSKSSGYFSKNTWKKIMNSVQNEV